MTVGGLAGELLAAYIYTGSSFPPRQPLHHSRREKVAIYMLFLKRDGSNNDFVLSRAGFVTRPCEFADLVTKTPERKRSQVSFRF